MADAWGGSWGVSWGISWGSAVTPPTPTPEPVQVRMYGGFGGPFRYRQEDVDDLVKLLFRVRKKKKKRAAKVREFEDAAVRLLNLSDAALPEVRRLIVDSATPLLAGQARQAELQTLVQALLQKAVDEAALLQAEMDEDEEDVMLLLGAN